MMKARLAGLILLMGLSVAAQASSHTFALDEEGADFGTAVQSAAFAGFDEGQVIKVDHDGHIHVDGFICIPIPEPGTYAMLLAGLGLMTTIARRKRMDR